MSEEELMKFIEECDSMGFRSIVVPPSYVRLAASIAKTPITTISAFPLGYSTTEIKLREIEEAANNGAKEVDVVNNVSLIKSRKWKEYESEIRKIVDLAHSLGLKVKIIIETGLLSYEEIMKVSKIIEDLNADFIKTCTGLGPRGVTINDVLLIRRAIKGKIGIKASGGIRSLTDAILFLLMGASCIGTSTGIRIVEEAKNISKLLESFEP